MSEKTKLQRQILVEAYDNPQLNQSEIADRLDCSSSYVSTVLNRYDSLDAMDARIEELNKQIGIASGSREPLSDQQMANPEFDMAEVESSVQGGAEGLKVLFSKIKRVIQKLSG